MVDAARLSGDSYWLPSNYDIFFKMAAFKMDSYHNDGTGKFGWDSIVHNKEEKNTEYKKYLTENL